MLLAALIALTLAAAPGPAGPVFAAVQAPAVATETVSSGGVGARYEALPAAPGAGQGVLVATPRGRAVTVDVRGAGPRAGVQTMEPGRTIVGLPAPDALPGPRPIEILAVFN